MNTVPQVGDLDQLPELDVPQVGDPRQLLKFLRYHMNERTGVGSQPIYHVFSALVVASDDETDRGLASYNFTDSPLVETVIKALENKAFTPLRKLTIFVLVKLDNHLFTTDGAFNGQKKASRFVTAWSSAIHEFLGDPTYRVEQAVLRVLFAIAHLPFLREHLPKERWALIEYFPKDMYGNPPLQRCLEDPDIFPYLKPITESRASYFWLAMLWIMHPHLSKEVREQLEEETREVAGGESFRDLQSYIAMFDLYLTNLKAQIDKLDPLHQTASTRRAKLERLTQAKNSLILIWNDMMKRSRVSK